MKMCCAVACGLLLSTRAFAQSLVEFEVASVKPAAQAIEQVGAGLRITDTQVRIASLTLKDFVSIAYGVKPSQVIAPDWVAQERFDISGNMPAGATRDQVPQMLQALLRDRFKLASHRERRDFPVYELAVARSGLKMKESVPDPGAPAAPTATIAGGSGSAAGVNLALPGGATFSLLPNTMEARNMTMAQLAEMFSRFADRPVLDATGLTARYDLSAPLTPDDYQPLLIRSAVNAGVVLPAQALRLLDAAPGNALGSVIAASGLTLEPRRAPLDVIVIDSALRTPTEN